MSELTLSEIPEEPTIPPPPRRFRWLRRLGCTLLLVIWFTILLMPCFMLVLATQQQITISQGSLPDQYLRIWLIMEPAQRGLGISTTSVHPPKDANLPADSLCLQTNVNYLLWQGQGETSGYCECYHQEDTNWTPVATYSTTCP